MITEGLKLGLAMQTNVSYLGTFKSAHIRVLLQSARIILSQTHTETGTNRFHHAEHYRL